TFDQPGTLEAAARLASDWFARSLSGAPPQAAAPAKRKIQIALTRDQQLAFAAATGAMIGVLEIDEDALEAGELPWAQIPGLTASQAPATGDDGGPAKSSR